jgi:hypothetical protein
VAAVGPATNALTAPGAAVATNPAAKAATGEGKKANDKHCHPIGFPMKSAFFANFDFLHCLKTRWKSELTQNPL